jgi:pilus assembly protein CpaC
MNYKFLCILVLALAMQGNQPVIAAEQLKAASVKQYPPVYISAGKTRVIQLGSAMTRVSVGNPEIVDVVLVKSRELYLIGKKTGSSNVYIWSGKDQMTVMDVVVGVDTIGIQSMLRDLMPNESSIQVKSAGDSLVLVGQVADAMKVNRAVMLAEQFGAKRVINMLRTDDVPQVMLEVKVAEVSKKLTDRLGVEFSVSGNRGSFTYSILGNFLTGGALSVPPGSGGGIDLSRTGDQFKLEAEIRNGLIKILAEPNIIAVSGQEGAFLAGGRIFIPVPQASGGLSTITLEEREFGVGLKFLPTVLEGGKINLRVTPEVSELALTGTTIKAGGNSSVLPTISTRRASTTVQLMDGQSFVIGGLIKNNITESVSGIPLLNEIPILGALFRSSEFISDRSELMFIVTPRLVKPTALAASLPTDKFIEPTRSEFLLEGRLEGRYKAGNAAQPAANSQPIATNAAAAPAEPAAITAPTEAKESQ